ncbi:hypothetical protein D9756_000599 [Leucocoprinus leucothites]|uniref:Pentatricopeptide repeat protein n=1 Tax=Leucocoprinus leucothites TaxID=201217 RepID=A0A8H5LNI8_9AGAR|nr:hypothetical protein D9756_000599 [Leucoagaricus leucothites]
MHRASSLGLYHPLTTITIIQRCLRAPGTTIGPRSLIFFRCSSATNLSVRLRQTGHREKLDGENFRLGEVARPIASSLLDGNDSWSDLQLEGLSVKAGLGEESTSAVETVGRESTGRTNISTQSVTESEASRAVGVEGGQESMPPPGPFVQQAPFLSGRPWARRPVEPLRTASRGRYIFAKGGAPSLEDGEVDVEEVYQDMLHVLATTTSAEDGWKAYGVLSQLQQQQDASAYDKDSAPIIPFAHLHRLARVIARNVPRTRSQFLRLLSVLTTIQNYGGEIQLHEWNALIDHAGKGYRKTRPEDFNNSLSIYYDMIHNRPPGSRFSGDSFDDFLEAHQADDPFVLHPSHARAVQPDIHTYTTLIDIAARTNHPPIVQRATMLLKQSGLAPNRITHLSLLKYFTAKGQVSGVRSTLTRMKEQNLDIGVDGLNACMWAYGHNNRVDLTMMIYRVLRHNMVPEEPDEADDITSVQERLHLEMGIAIPPDLRPNEVTFTLMIQTMAYHGNLLAALSIFLDLLSTPNSEQGAPLVLDEKGELQRTTYTPTIHVFRAILLGFSRHGVSSNTTTSLAASSNPDSNGLDWNLENLQNIFERFLDLPPDIGISESTIFWALNAFSKTSGHDVELLRTVWLRVENRFGTFKRGPNHRLTKWRHKLFPE